MTRSPRQTMYLIAALLFGVAPLVFGLLRLSSPRHDATGLWMALAVSVFAAGVLAASIGRRRSRHAVFIQAAVILAVSTLLAAGIGFALGATSGPGVWAVAFVLGLCLAASSVFIALSREAIPEQRG